MMHPRRLAVGVVAGVLAPGGAGGGSDSGANHTAVHLSDDLLQAEGHDPDYGGPSQPDHANSFSVDTDASGLVTDFEEGFEVVGIEVRVYAPPDDAINEQPFDVSAPSDPNGTYSITVPADVTRVIRRTTDTMGDAFSSQPVRLFADTVAVTDAEPLKDFQL